MYILKSNIIKESPTWCTALIVIFLLANWADFRSPRWKSWDEGLRLLAITGPYLPPPLADKSRLHAGG
jgi:hypothetical protein